MKEKYKDRKSTEELDNLGEVIAHLRETQELKWDDVARKLKLGLEECRNIYRRRQKKNPNTNKTTGNNQGGNKQKNVHDGETYEEAIPDKNHVDVSNIGERITTLEQLLAFAKVDLNVWEVEHWIVNKWEGFRKDESKDLEFNQGTIDGWSKDSGLLLTTPLFQIKAWMVRKEPIALTPFVSVVKVSGHVHPKKQYIKGTLKLSLEIPDTHIGFIRDFSSGKLIPLHDRRALNIVSQIAATLPFERIDIMGDLFDMTEVTDKFIHSPEFDYTLQPAINEAGWWLSELRSACPNAEMNFIEGNHDLRYYNAIVTKVPHIYNIKPKHMSGSFWELRNLLSLDDMNIKWNGHYPNGEVWINENLRVIHGAETSAKNVVDKSDCSTIFGHIHRLEQASRTVWHKGGYRTITAFSPGFLGRMDGVVPGVKAKQNWSQGFAIVEYDKDGFQIQHIPIINGSAIYDRSRWTGEDYGDKF